MSKSACLVAEETSASKNELDEISKIMSAMSAMSVQIPEDAPYSVGNCNRVDTGHTGGSSTNCAA